MYSFKSNCGRWTLRHTSGRPGSGSFGPDKTMAVALAGGFALARVHVYSCAVLHVCPWADINDLNHSVVLQVPGAWKWALLVNIFSWYMQIHPGHAVLEGRKPALLDSFVQVSALAAGVLVIVCRGLLVAAPSYALHL